MATIAVVKSGIEMTLLASATIAEAMPEAEQRGADRQAHRQHRTEGQDEDDDGGDDAEDLALGQLERRRTGRRRTRSPAPRPPACSSPKSLISVPSSVTSSKPRSVTSSWAKAMVPSALTCWGLSYGLVTWTPSCSAGEVHDRRQRRLDLGVVDVGRPG